MPAIAKATKETTADTSGLRPVHAVANFLSVSRSKVYQLMDSGELPYVKLGKSRRVRWADVVRLVDVNTVSRDAS
jgi:excisionase family DNA binding protein